MNIQEICESRGRKRNEWRSEKVCLWPYGQQRDDHTDVNNEGGKNKNILQLPQSLAQICQPWQITDSKKNVTMKNIKKNEEKQNVHCLQTLL